MGSSATLFLSSSPELMCAKLNREYNNSHCAPLPHPGGPMTQTMGMPFKAIAMHNNREIYHKNWFYDLDEQKAFVSLSILNIVTITSKTEPDMLIPTKRQSTFERSQNMSLQQTRSFVGKNNSRKLCGAPNNYHMT